MQPETFESSDELRSGRPLPFAQAVTFAQSLVLERGGVLPEFQVVYETYGRLNAARDNAVLICHALTGDSHVARHNPQDDPGWWDIVVGPGKAIDTDRYFVICPNILGGCRGSTGPNSINPHTSRPWGASFPAITIADIVEVQKRLLDHLGIERLHAVVGGSLGGHMALTWAVRHPDRVAATAAIATSPRLTSQALAFDVVGRNAILRDPVYQRGQHQENGEPLVGLALARMLGHITYLSREAMMRKFDPTRFQPHDIVTQFEKKFSVGSYLAYQGDKFVERFDPDSYLVLTMAMDLFDLGSTPQQLTEALGASQCRWLIVSYTSDWLFPPFQSQELVDALIARHRPVSYCNVQTQCGHDAFLLPDELESYGEMLRAFLNNVESAATAPATPPPAAGTAEVVAAAPPTGMASLLPGAPDGERPTSIFHQRLDYDTILELIRPGASVLDLGCGTGGLLARLKRRGHRRLLGLEQDERAILECIRRGLDVIQADLNKGLPAFLAGQFDYVILSQTLQAVMNVEQVIEDMLRVGGRGIVSFPNLGFSRFRTQLAEEGRAPRLTATENVHWYDTPDVRFLTLADFEEFCREKGIRIHNRVALDTQRGCQVFEDPNRHADVAIMIISR